MSQELIYTSVPRGLKPGSKGFCTVAMSAGMPAALIERLESLSGYRPVFALGSARVADNPINWSHYRLQGTRSLLSRVAFAGVDYSQRSNKFAHHVVLDPPEQSAAGPAWALSQPGFMLADWKSDPQILSAPRPVPAAPPSARPPRPCTAWTYVAGDAGWAGVLAASFIESRTKPAYVIYPAGTDVLALFEEALSLLEPAVRWQVTFSTYFTSLPVGLDCAWRGVPVESAVAKEVLRSTAPRLLIDLTQPMTALPQSPFVHAAREGTGPTATATKSTPRSAPHSLELQPEDPDQPSGAAKSGPRRRLVQELQEPIELTDEHYAPSNFALSTPPPISKPRRSRFPIVALMTASIIVLLLGAAAAVFVLKTRVKGSGPTAVSIPKPTTKPTDEATVVVSELRGELAEVPGDPEGTEKRAGDIAIQHPKVMIDPNVALAMKELKDSIATERQRHEDFSHALEMAIEAGMKNPDKADFQSVDGSALTYKEKAAVKEARSKITEYAQEQHDAAERQRHETFRQELEAANERFKKAPGNPTLQTDVATLAQQANTIDEKSGVGTLRDKMAEYARSQQPTTLASTAPAPPAEPIKVTEIHLHIPRIGLGTRFPLDVTDPGLPEQWTTVMGFFPDNSSKEFHYGSGSLSFIQTKISGNDPLTLQRQHKSAAGTRYEFDRLELSPHSRSIALSVDSGDAQELLGSEGILQFTRIEITGNDGKKYSLFWRNDSTHIQLIPMTLGSTSPTKVPTLRDNLGAYARLSLPGDNVPQGWHWVQDGTGIIGIPPDLKGYKEKFEIGLSSNETIQASDNFAACLKELDDDGELDAEVNGADTQLADAKKLDDKNSIKKDQVRKAQESDDMLKDRKKLRDDFRTAIFSFKPFPVQILLKNDVPIATIQIMPPAKAK